MPALQTVSSHQSTKPSYRPLVAATQAAWPRRLGIPRTSEEIQPKLELSTIASNRRTLFDGLEARISNACHITASARGSKETESKYKERLTTPEALRAHGAEEEFITIKDA
jgi:hypothetical protein